MLKSGVLGALVLSDSKRTSLSPEDVLLSRFSDYLKRPDLAGQRNEVIVGLVEALCAKALGKREPMKKAVIDCLMMIRRVDPKSCRFLRVAVARVNGKHIVPHTSTFKRKEKVFRATSAGTLDGLLARDKKVMKTFIKVKARGFSSSIDEIYLSRREGVIGTGDKKIIIGLETPVLFEPGCFEKLTPYKKLAQSALLCLAVPQCGSEVCEPYHTRIGGANADGETSIGTLCNDACEEYAKENSLEFYGTWVDAVGKCSPFVWQGLYNAFSGAKSYPRLVPVLS